MDLVSIDQFSRDNNGIKYLLCVIDSYTKMAWVRGLKTKSSVSFLESFKDIIKAAVVPPKTLISDKGTEMKNNLFQTYCKSNNIRLIFTEDHANIVERFNKTIQNRIYKYLYSILQN